MENVKPSNTPNNPSDAPRSALTDNSSVSTCELFEDRSHKPKSAPAENSVNVTKKKGIGWMLNIPVV